MVEKLYYDVNDMTWHTNGDAAQTLAPEAQAPAVPSGAQLWKAAVQAVAADAKASLPRSSGRIDSAVALVLAGDAEVTGEHTGRVASQTDGETTYVVCNGECECRDFARAPEGWCKHRLALAILRRATQRASAQAKALDSPSVAQETHAVFQTPPPAAAPAASLPEAPASANAFVQIDGHRVQITVRGHTLQGVLTEIRTVLKQFPAEAAPEAAKAPGGPAAPVAPPAPAAPGPVLHTPPPAESWCGLHGLYMQWNEPKPGDRRPGWYSHKIDGQWCRGRVPGGK